uniref:nuclear transport factor 2 family protein n=1 Tax=Parabacteroides distasonis TaxID=823 RepID=UPI003FEF9B21
MRSLFIATLLLVSMGMGAYAQETKKTFTPKQQEMIDLSNAKWKWMSEKDVDKLDALFHENSMFVHMDGSWGKQPELDVIRTGNIHYKHAEIHDVDVKFAGCAGIVYSRIHLNSVVGGREVRFPFIVTETYVKEDGQWKLATLAFTRTVGE